MELDVLRRRAEKIVNGNPPSNLLQQEFRYLQTRRRVPNWNFTCSGRITSVLLGVDLQNRQQYSQVQIWRRASSVLSQFNKVGSRQIILNVGNFTPSGVFQYKLISPMQFQSGDVLRIFLPSQGG